MTESESISKKLIVSCPTCDKEIVWSNQQKFRPFCCERCKLIDLGEWAAEEKKIAGESINSEQDFDSYLQ